MIKSAFFILALAQTLNLTTATKSTTTCNADNCARAVTGTRYPPTVQSDHRADCSSFLLTTITPATSTVTVTITAAPVKRDGGILEARQVVQTPSAVPSYASACNGPARYSSACSCAGITAATTYAPTPTTTVYTTVPYCPKPKADCGGICKDPNVDPANCGSCGKKCPEGSVCENGVCSRAVCNGSQCGSLSDCGENCFCFETASQLGFCGPGTSCAPLPDCNSNADCASGTVCATGTCCGRNVCLGPQGCDSGVGISQRSLFGRQVGGDDTWTSGNSPKF